MGDWHGGGLRPQPLKETFGSVSCKCSSQLSWRKKNGVVFCCLTLGCLLSLLWVIHWFPAENHQADETVQQSHFCILEHTTQPVANCWSPPRSLHLLWQIVLLHPSFSAWLSGETAHHTGGTAGLQWIFSLDPRSPVVSSHLKTPLSHISSTPPMKSTGTARIP